MVIDPGNNVNGSSLGAAKGKPSTSAPLEPKSPEQTPSQAPVEAEEGKVSLSGQGQALNQLEASINASPEVDRDRVEAIKLAISNGSFQINSEKIAENLLKQEDLLAKF